MIKKIFIKEKMLRKQTLIGAWNTIASPSVTEIIASAGLDFVIVDFEHGPFNTAELSSYYNAAVLHGVSPISRVPVVQEWMIQQCLDQGAHGIIYPHVKDMEDVKNICQFSKYPPHGLRGFSPFTKATSFNDKTFENYPKFANENLINIALVEDLEGLKNIAELSANDQIDVIYFGSYDISSALGIAGQTRHTKVLDAVFEAAAIAKSNGKYVGGFLCTDAKDAKWLEEKGMNFLVYQVDSFLLRKSFASFAEEFRGLK